MASAKAFAAESIFALFIMQLSPAAGVQAYTFKYLKTPGRKFHIGPQQKQIKSGENWKRVGFFMAYLSFIFNRAAPRDVSLAVASRFLLLRLVLVGACVCLHLGTHSGGGGSKSMHFAPAGRN